MTSLIFRELESSIAQTQALEEALKKSQGALMRAQFDLEARLLMKSESERGSTAQHEKEIQALKDEFKKREEAIQQNFRALEEKLKVALSKNHQLTEQMKAGAAKWDQLVLRVKTQNEKISHFSDHAETERLRLIQELNMEKARASVMVSERDRRIEALQLEIARMKRALTAAQPVAPQLVQAISTMERAQKQREQLAEMMRQSQSRLAKGKRPIEAPAPIPARANQESNVKPIKPAASRLSP
jgi:chromosome segregation ATPase